MWLDQREWRGEHSRKLKLGTGVSLESWCEIFAFTEWDRKPFMESHLCPVLQKNKIRSDWKVPLGLWSVLFGDLCTQKLLQELGIREQRKMKISALLRVIFHFTKAIWCSFFLKECGIMILRVPNGCLAIGVAYKSEKPWQCVFCFNSPCFM